MSFFCEKQSRHYFQYLVGLCVLLFFFGFFCIRQEACGIKRALAENNRAAASSLLEQGVAPEVIAAAFQNEQTSSQGMILMEQIGRTERTAGWLLSAVRRNGGRFAWLLFSGMIVFAGCLLAGTVFFLGQRERMYQEAFTLIQRFAEGNFEKHLSRNQTGTVYQLLHAVDQLAMALQAKNEAEQKSKEFLKNMISDISHQLKTPLTALMMYTEIMAEEPENVETVRIFLQKSEQSLGRIKRLLSMLMKIMCLDAGSIVFQKKRCNMEELVQGAVQELRIRAQQEGKQIQIEGKPDMALICDREWMGEAVENLVKNALDYMDRGGTVHIAWERSPAMMRLIVSDNGRGISPEEIHHIFKRFYRGSHAAPSADKYSDTLTGRKQERPGDCSGANPGTGLGLPLAKAIVEGQGGMICVQSEVGEGTTFTISFLTEV